LARRERGALLWATNQENRHRNPSFRIFIARTTSFSLPIEHKSFDKPRFYAISIVFGDAISHQDGAAWAIHAPHEEKFRIPCADDRRPTVELQVTVVSDIRRPMMLRGLFFHSI
jgi:hypothetical protein